MLAKVSSCPIGKNSANLVNLDFIDILTVGYVKVYICNSRAPKAIFNNMVCPQG
jgi:hypothetical protein